MISPLSSYARPSNSPCQVIGLPGFQSVFTSEPNMYSLMSPGSVSARQTSSGAASISHCAVATCPDITVLLVPQDAVSLFQLVAYPLTVALTDEPAVAASSWVNASGSPAGNRRRPEPSQSWRPACDGLGNAAEMARLDRGPRRISRASRTSSDKTPDPGVSVSRNCQKGFVRTAVAS